MRHRIRNLTWTNEDGGFSMVEVIIAMFVFSVAVLGLASVSMTSIMSLRHTRDREQATNAASAVIEAVRARDFYGIFLDVDAPEVIALGGCFEGEPVVDDAVNAPAGSTAVPHVQTAGNGGVVEVTTTITYAQDPDASPGTCDGTDASTDVKRVITVAQWEDRDGVREVRQETLVTDAGRGLPVPDFDFTPLEATLTTNIDDTTSSPTKEVCARHQLRNLGSGDTYDWALNSVDGAASGPFRLDSSKYETPSGKWVVRAFMQYPATSGASTPPDPATDPTTVLMTDADGTPPNRPESPLEVQPGDSANFWFCYTPKEDSLVVGDSITARLEVHSRFDANRFEEIVHTLTVVDVQDVFYLYDRLDNTAHDRDSDPNTNKTVYPTFTMGVEDGIAGSPDNLGTIDYGDRSLSDWDREVDVDQLPGLRLVRSNSALRTVAWHEGFLDATTIESSGTLTLYVSTTEALKGQVISTDSSTHQPQVFQVSLARLAKNERLPGDPLWSASVSYTQNQSGWMKLDIPVSFGGDVAFDNNQFLRLQMTCATSAASDCHVGYDNVALPSGLAVGIQ